MPKTRFVDAFQLRASPLERATMTVADRKWDTPPPAERFAAAFVATAPDA